MSQPFLLFSFRCSGYDEQPEGGWNDFVGAFATQADAEEAGRTMETEDDVWHVVSMHSMVVVAKGECKREPVRPLTEEEIEKLSPMAQAIYRESVRIGKAIAEHVAGHDPYRMPSLPSAFPEGMGHSIAPRVSAP